MKRNGFFLILIGVALTMLLLFGSSLLNPKVEADQSAIATANSLYEIGRYNEAIQVHNQIVSRGAQDSSIFFNLGNAYYQLGDYGRAILNFQRAANLDPRDDDIQANLILAENAANVEVPEIAPGPLTIISNLTGQWLTVNETAMLALGLWFIVGFLFLIWRFIAPRPVPTGIRYAAAAASMLLLLIVISLGGRLLIEETQSDGVVVAPVVTLRSEPGEQFDTGLEIFAGAQVDLIEQQGEWIQLVGAGQSYRGWVPASSVEIIVGRPGHANWQT